MPRGHSSRHHLMRISDSIEEKTVKLKSQNKELNDMETRISKGLSALEEYSEDKINALEEKLNARLGALESKMDPLMLNRINAIEQKLDSRLGALESKTDALMSLMQQVLLLGEQRQSN